MRVHGRPIQAALPDPSVGDETMAAAGLLVMDDENDVQLTTGWYWARTGPHAPADDVETWKTAILEGRGPLRSADQALQAAETATIEAFDVASRAAELAEVVRAGEIEPTLEAATEFMTAALRMDRETREAAADPTRSAKGLQAKEAKRAIDELPELPEGGPEILDLAALGDESDPILKVGDVLVTDEEAAALERDLVQNADPVEKAYLEEHERRLREAQAEEDQDDSHGGDRP